MGLDTSHDCWHGAYSAFARWRKRIAAAVGINLDSMEGFGGSRSWSEWALDPIAVLLNHSDCDGEIAHEVCGPLADRLEGLLPLLLSGNEGGHVGDQVIARHHQ